MSSPRSLAFAAILLAVPAALVGWVARRGHGPPRQAAAAWPGGEVALDRVFEGLAPEARLKAPVAYYDEKGLFEYINGAAPLYLARRFRRLGAAELVLAGGGEAVADVYDMATPDDAASIFAAERSDSAREVPGFEGAVAGPLSFVFRRGRFYVKLTGFDARAEAELPTLARALERRLR